MLAPGQIGKDCQIHVLGNFVTVKISSYKPASSFSGIERRRFLGKQPFADSFVPHRPPRYPVAECLSPWEESDPGGPVKAL